MMGGGYSRPVSRPSIVFWEYRDDHGCNPVWNPTSQYWSLGYRKVNLTELGIFCKLSKDELTFLKLKYGG